MGKTVWCAYSEQELDFNSHWHFGNELILVCEGQMEVIVAEKKYTVSAGQMLLIQRLVHHFTERTAENFGRYCLIVQPNELHKNPVCVNMLSHLTNSGEEPARLIDLKEDAKEAEHILSLVPASFEKLGLDYDTIGIHWRGGENDMIEPREVLENTLEPIYHEIFVKLNALLCSSPILLHKI